MTDDAAKRVRCVACGEQARLVGAVDHVRRTRSTGAEMSQGSTLRYACSRCKRSFSLLGRERRRWFFFGVMMGIGCIALSPIFDRIEMTVFAVMGGLATLFCAAVLLRDFSVRRRT